MELPRDLTLTIGLVALGVAAYGMVAAALARRSVSAAFAFLVIGAIVGGLGLAQLERDRPLLAELSWLVEVTLALVLFVAASTVRLQRLEMDSTIVGRLLVVGLPLTIATGTILALGLFPGLSLPLALLIGTVLAPTDADLGQQVITDPAVPARIRRVLNVESGLNDGIAAPVVTVAITLSVAGAAGIADPALDAARELLVAVVVGIVVGASGGWLLLRADARGMTSTTSRQLATLALPVAAYFLAVALAASGFVAAFVAGIAFGFGRREHVASLVEFSEALSVLLSIIVWLAFGLLVAGEYALDLADPAVIAYALLALTLMRMLPVAIALAGTRFRPATVAFIGWFGPRGLASIVFTLLALETLDAAGSPSEPLASVVVWTIVLSVILHGFSARPLAAIYGRFAGGLASDAPEHVGEAEPRRAGWVLHHHRPHRS